MSEPTFSEETIFVELTIEDDEATGQTVLLMRAADGKGLIPMANIRVNNRTQRTMKLQYVTGETPIAAGDSKNILSN